MVRTVTLGDGRLDVTPIGLGCMPFSGPGRAARLAMKPLDQDTVTGVVRAALAGGVRWFDTAEMYGGGHSERALTTALHACGVRPGEVVIATKWVPIGRRAGHLERSVEQRLDCLQGFGIDLHQVHVPVGGLSSLRAQLVAMARLVRAGLVRHVGVSNFSARGTVAAHRLLADEGVPLVSNQVRLHLLHRDVERNGVLEAARGLGVTLIAHSPLESGLLTGRFHADPALAAALPPLRRLLRRRALSPSGLARTAPLIDELRAIGTARGLSVAQVALAWLVTNYGDTVVAIPGASTPRQATEAAAAADVTLDADELARLDARSR